MFAKADLKKFTATKGSSKEPAKAKNARPKAPKKAVARVRPTVKTAPAAKEQPKKPLKRSFWDFLMDRKSKRKVQLMDVRKK